MIDQDSSAALQPRKWYFMAESAIYERIGFGADGGLYLEDSNRTVDQILKYWSSCGCDDPVYRYFWHWGLLSITGDPW